MRVTKDLADRLAIKAIKEGITVESTAENLDELLDLWTAGDLDTIQMDIMHDMVIERIRKYPLDQALAANAEAQADASSASS